MSDARLTFADDLAALVVHAGTLVERAAEIAAMRAKDGRQLGTATQEQLAALASVLKDLASAVDAIAAGEAKDAAETALQRETERFKRLTKGETT